MSSDSETRDIARGLIDLQLGLCYSRHEAQLCFQQGSDDDPLVRRLGRAEFLRRQAEAERLFAEQYPEAAASRRAGCRASRSDERGRREAR